ncbi:hypothetical protein [Macromonas nakdongensis]|uniref:hypothetical protein n=1 Tax=Macromonas nakdongensis TaxID=1843082 RepID=UPI000C32C58E|nr:hypothetical protein [Macromonas nakdongensis]
MNKIERLAESAGQLNAQELDGLISALAMTRATMSPPVSHARPKPTDESAMDTPVTVEDSPAMEARLLRDGRVRLWARSSGFGWLAFNLEPRNARVLRDWLAANVEGASDLIGQQNAQRH